MAKKNDSRGLVTLACSKCKSQNYSTSKNKKNTTEKLNLNKYCPKCQATTEHTEKK